MIPTASGLELAARCPGSLTLPHAHESNPDAERGTADHAADEDAINAGNVPDAYLERWPEVTHWRAEVSYAYDLSTDTGRLLGVGLKRAYGTLGPFETCGTIDAEGRGPGLLVVVDKKGYAKQTPATRHPQVRFLALAAARAEPAERIEVAIAPATGVLDVATLSPDFDLDLIAHDTRRMLIESAETLARARRGEQVPFHIGPWCRWCNAFNACPKQDELRALVMLGEDHPEQDILHHQDAARQYEMMQRASILYKRLKTTVYGIASQAPIRLASGKLFGPRTTEGDRVYDGAKVHAEVARRFDREVADRVVEMKTSQAQFKRVLQPLAPPRGYSKLAKEVFGAVEEAGGMKRKPSVEFVEYVPDEELPF